MSRRFDLDISTLRAFVVVAERSTMTAAATVLNLTQGAVSQQMTRLEAQLGSQLFERGGRGVTLTAAGQRLRIQALSLLGQHDELCAAFLGQVVAGQVRFGVPYDLAGAYISTVLKAFAERHPDVELSLMCGSSTELLAKIARGELDLALIEAPASVANGECIRTARLVWIGAAGGRASKRTPLPVSIVSETCVFRPIVIDTLTKLGIPWRVAMNNGGIDATLACVSADLAIAAWLEPFVPQGLEVIQKLADVPALPAFSISLHLANPNPSPAVAALAEIIREQLPKQPERDVITARRG